MEKITKAEIIDNIYKNLNYERKTVLEIIDAFKDELKAGLSSGHVIELRGFGTFEPRLRKGREGGAINPKTGEACNSVSHYVAVFRAGQELEKSLRELPVENNE